MKLDFITLLTFFALILIITGVHSQGKTRKTPLEGSGSGLGPGEDDEDRGGSQLKNPPPKKKPQRRPPISPSDRNRWPAPESSAALPESRRWSSKSRDPDPPLRVAPVPKKQPPPPPPQKNAARQPQELPQQGDEGSGNVAVTAGVGGGQAPPDQERTPRVLPSIPNNAPPPQSNPVPQLTEMPISCQEAARRGKRLHYYPRCDAAGRYERRQCGRDDCMCVSPDTGIVLEKTIALREKNISCDEVRYIIQLPLRRPLSPYDDHSMIQSKVVALLESLLDNLPGQQRLEFQRYLPNRSSPITGLEVLCRSVGHSDPSALARFITTQAAKGSLPFVGATTAVNVTRLSSAPAVKDTGSVGNSGQFNAAKDTPADQTDPNAPRNDDSQAGRRKKKTGAAAFLQQPGIIAAIIGGGIAGFFLAILLILFCIYRIRKKDEGSYALEEPKKMPVSAAVYHSAPTREYYA